MFKKILAKAAFLAGYVIGKNRRSQYEPKKRR